MPLYNLSYTDCGLSQITCFKLIWYYQALASRVMVSTVIWQLGCLGSLPPRSQLPCCKEAWVRFWMMSNHMERDREGYEVIIPATAEPPTECNHHSDLNPYKVNSKIPSWAQSTQRIRTNCCDLKPLSFVVVCKVKTGFMFKKCKNMKILIKSGRLVYAWWEKNKENHVN